MQCVPQSRFSLYFELSTLQ